jgi:glucose/arabinose dehydrogenase
MMLRRQGRRALALLAAVAVVGAACYGALWPIKLADGWKIVDTIDLPRPDSLAIDSAGKLRYATLETRPGRLVELIRVGPKTVFGEFDEPDGLLAGTGSLVVTEEEPAGRVMAYDPGTTTLRVLARMDSPEGLLRRPDGSLWAVLSQRRCGELVRIHDGRRRVIASHLREPQGIALAPDGSLYLAETRADRVLHLAPQ